MESGSSKVSPLCATTLLQQHVCVCCCSSGLCVGVMLSHHTDFAPLRCASTRVCVLLCSVWGQCLGDSYHVCDLSADIWASGSSKVSPPSGAQQHCCSNTRVCVCCCSSGLCAWGGGDAVTPYGLAPVLCFNTCVCVAAVCGAVWVTSYHLPCVCLSLCVHTTLQNNAWRME